MTLTKIYARCKQQGTCRIWQGATTRKGYPYIYCPDKRRTQNTRGSSECGRPLVWALKHGGRPSGVIRMTCGNRLCLQHTHMQDVSKTELGRLASEAGSFHSLRHSVARVSNARKSAKLNWEAVAVIRQRASHLKPKTVARRREVVALAAQFGVSVEAIYDAMRGRRWQRAPVANSSVFAVAA